MPDVLTNNLQLLEQATGTASGSWGANLNTQVIAILDQALGNNQAVSVSSSDVTLTMTQRQNLIFTLSGTLTSNVAVKLPFNANSTTVAVGGQFIFDNQATGAFSVTVKTVASGSTGVEVPQGVHSYLCSDGTNVNYADDAQNQLQSFNGNPNGNVAGKAASAATRASRIIDRSTNIEYLCTTSGTASSAVWFPNMPFSIPSGGYLTASSDANNVVLTVDSVGATTIYYTAFSGGYYWVYNGTSFSPAPITGGQLSLSLSASAQAANGLYDIIGFLNGTASVVGFSPAWSSATAGSCSRGTGAGTPQMTRIQGVPVNAVQQTVNNGATTYTVAANRGTILGTVFIDSSAGQVTCHRTYGQSRKFGIWNVYNRLPIYLKGGDSTANWDVTSSTVGPANGSANNKVTTMCGLAEEVIDYGYIQKVISTAGFPVGIYGVGYNVTNAISGVQGTMDASTTFVFSFGPARYLTPPSLGINVATALNANSAAAGTTRFYGTEASMLLSATYRG